jgi:hypothetical protein
MSRGASFSQRIRAFSSLAAFVGLLIITNGVQAQCVTETPASNLATSNRTLSGRSALRSTLDGANAAAQVACRKPPAGQASEARRLSTSLSNPLSLGAIGDVIAHDTRIAMDPLSRMPTRIEAEIGSPIASRFDVHWQSTPGPAWVQNVPDWVTSNAKYYRHRGLPLVHLWESSHYLVALGLSNHGVPGVYFSQKLP